MDLGPLNIPTLLAVATFAERYAGTVLKFFRTMWRGRRPAELPTPPSRPLTTETTLEIRVSLRKQTK